VPDWQAGLIRSLTEAQEPVGKPLYFSAVYIYFKIEILFQWPKAEIYNLCFPCPSPPYFGLSPCCYALFFIAFSPFRPPLLRAPGTPAGLQYVSTCSNVSLTASLFPDMKSPLSLSNGCPCPRLTLSPLYR